MRHQYTCIFRRTLTSRIWTLSAAARCIWLWMRLTADPEGDVSADLRGIAEGARVPIELARDALLELAAVDPDAHPGDPYEGRIIERTAFGWRVLGIEELTELVRQETKRARTRSYMRASRAKVANDNGDVSHGDPETTTVTPSRSRSKSRSKDLSEEISPLPPKGSAVSARSVTLDKLPEAWAPSDELRSEARLAGVERLDEHIKTLRTGPIGGARGVLPDQLDNYIRNQFGRWRTWEETERAKASQRDPAAPPIAPKPQVQGKPRWVRRTHLKAAEGHGFDIDWLIKRFVKEHHIPPDSLDAPVAAQAFAQFIERVAKEAA